MAYREASAPPKQVVEVRPTPTIIAVIMVLAGVAFAVPGALLTAASVAMFFEMVSGDKSLIPPLMGVCFTAFGVGFSIAGYRMLRTVVRFAIDDAFVTMEWLRGRRCLRTERLAREDIVDVALDTTTSSGDGQIFRIVVGTKNGDIALTDGYTNAPGTHRKNAQTLSGALGVPLRL